MPTHHGNGVGVATADPGLTTFTRISTIYCDGNCYSTDQPHIVADRLHTSAGGGDRLYVAWRNFPTKGLPATPTMTCSSDGGRTWLNHPVALFTNSGDFARLAVGADGMVYALFAAGSSLMLSKYGPCDSGLRQQDGFPVTVASFQSVVCPVPGMDRCNVVNLMNSPSIAADESDARHLYVAWATSTKPSRNEDVLIADSIDGGSSFRTPVRVNSPVPARRYLPWVAADGADAFVGWYDRRAGVKPAPSDLTQYYAAKVATGFAGLSVVSETNVSGAADPQCGNLWPTPPGSETDATACTEQPQYAGVCQDSNPSHKPVPCDYKLGCPGGRQCNVGEGLPKYGDYNGMGARNGTRYSLWSSSLPYEGAPPDGRKRLFIYMNVARVP
jgi:hypothetical protein